MCSSDRRPTADRLHHQHSCHCKTNGDPVDGDPLSGQCIHCPVRSSTIPQSASTTSGSYPAAPSLPLPASGSVRECPLALAPQAPALVPYFPAAAPGLAAQSLRFSKVEEVLQHLLRRAWRASKDRPPQAAEPRVPKSKGPTLDRRRRRAARRGRVAGVPPEVAMSAFSSQF